MDEETHLPSVFVFPFLEPTSVKLEELEEQRCNVLAQTWSSERTESPAWSPTSCVPLGKVINLPEPPFPYLEMVVFIMVTVITIMPATLQDSCEDYKNYSILLIVGAQS